MTDATTELLTPLTELIVSVERCGQSQCRFVGGPTREESDAELTERPTIVERRGGEIAIHREPQYLDGCLHGYPIHGTGPFGTDRLIGFGQLAPPPRFAVLRKKDARRRPGIGSTKQCRLGGLQWHRGNWCFGEVAGGAEPWDGFPVAKRGYEKDPL
ncbi:MAG TPA: hypothetical protein VH482_06855 [Thermomicrobiales bacterium]